MIKRVNHSLDRATICCDILKKSTGSYTFDELNKLQQLAEENMMFAEYYAGEPIGFCSFFSHNSETLEISLIAVMAVNQRQSIGSSLIKEVYLYAKNNDYKIIDAKIPKGQVFLAARKFFTKNRFINLEEINGYQVMVLPIYSEVL